MGDVNNIWLNLLKYSPEYSNGARYFVKNASANFGVGDELRCPCKKCNNRKWHVHNVVYDHLICYSPSSTYLQWICDVSYPNLKNSTDNMGHDTNSGIADDLDDLLHAANQDIDTKNIYRLVEDGKQPLYPGCKNFSRLSFVVRLYLLKCSHGITESAFGDILKLIKEAFPDINIPSSFNDAKNIIQDLGLDYQKIHACPNDCMLYWRENEPEQQCKSCETSRWRSFKKDESNGIANEEATISAHKVPAKVMIYFALKPRLQRMFMCKEYSKLMTWHSSDRKNDGKLRHPADGQAWKSMDVNYPLFSSESRNVRMGLASDGFNPFRTMSISHSTWLIILVNYNIPPYLSMKSENLIISTLIPGPKSPGNNIDVYMKPLIAELKDLWDMGIETYDALNNQTFQLHAALLWTISDFPGYAMLSGWSTKGKLACPVCNYETSSMYLKHSKKMCYMNHIKFLNDNHKWRADKKRFNGDVEEGTTPGMLSGTEIEELLHGYENQYGKQMTKQKMNGDSPWKKKSSLFDLPYWSSNLIRHNLDVMHIEKNICDNILGTLLNMDGKTKDHVNARLDLQEMGIRKELHPIASSDGKRLQIKPARFDMTNNEKEIFYSILVNAKLPYGSVYNIGRCVQMNERKIAGYKSHDAHFILQYLLQFAAKSTLKPEVAVPLIRLGAFFRGICSKVIDLDEIKKLQVGIIEILCQLEMIFPPAFFDIMVHLPIRLCKEIEFGGPVQNRWMFPIEQYLGKLKTYVRNKSKPEGSIAEGYLAEECLTFCSRYLTEDGKQGVNNPAAGCGPSYGGQTGYHIGSRRNKDGKTIHLDDQT